MYSLSKQFYKSRNISLFKYGYQLLTRLASGVKKEKNGMNVMNVKRCT